MKLLVLKQPCNLNVLLILNLRTEITAGVTKPLSVSLLDNIFTAAKNTIMWAMINHCIVLFMYQICCGMMNVQILPRLILNMPLWHIIYMFLPMWVHYGTFYTWSGPEVYDTLAKSGARIIFLQIAWRHFNWLWQRIRHLR